MKNSSIALAAKRGETNLPARFDSPRAGRRRTHGFAFSGNCGARRNGRGASWPICSEIQCLAADVHVPVNQSRRGTVCFLVGCKQRSGADRADFCAATRSIPAARVDPNATSVTWIIGENIADSTCSRLRANAHNYRHRFRRIDRLGNSQAFCARRDARRRDR